MYESDNNVTYTGRTKDEDDQHSCNVAGTTEYTVDHDTVDHEYVSVQHGDYPYVNGNYDSSAQYREGCVVDGTADNMYGNSNVGQYSPEVRDTRLDNQLVRHDGQWQEQYNVILGSSYSVTSDSVYETEDRGQIRSVTELRLTQTLYYN